jgi:hypothetical protein
VLRRLLPSAYRPVLASRVFRRLILGFAVSYLGDGMSFVAVAWLAIELAPQATAGLWVDGAVAAYTVGSLDFAASIAGPAIAGVLVTYVSSALVVGLDALT